MITGLLLAAGAARRFGADKLAAPLAGGEPLVLRAAARMAAAVDRLLVVVNTTSSDSARLLRVAGFAVVPCPEANLGMAHSLACGVRASRDSSAWVIGLADMPLLETRTIAQLIARFAATDCIVVPRHGGRDGHPVVFPARHAEALLALEGDRGARALLDAHAAEVSYVEVDDPGVLIDVDTPGDLDGIE